MFLRGYYYYLEKPTRCYHACLHVNVPPSNSSLSSSPLPHALILAVILLQKMTFPDQPVIFRTLLSKSHHLHSSRCSCVSSVSSSQNLQERLLNDLLLFTLTPLIDLALTLIHILLFGRVMYVRYFL